MPRVIPADGPRGPILLVAERCGYEEARYFANYPERPPFNLIGPAGAELWARLWRCAHLDRQDIRVCNLVPTFSKEPPSPAEIAEHSWRLKAELLACRPTLIITIGYHAARWFLPEYQHVRGDFFHGIPHEISYGRAVPRRAVVIPCVHSSAALRQPGQYQHVLTSDLTAVGQYLSKPVVPRRPRLVEPYRVGLAGFGKAGLTIAVDTEFTDDRTECVTLNADRNMVACIEPKQNVAPQFLRSSIVSASRLVSHMAKAEYHALFRLGIDLTLPDMPVVEDTMLMAYELNLPQSLKVLAYRELGIQMQEFADLVEPIDEHNCRSTLESHYAQIQQDIEVRDQAVAALKADTRTRLDRLRARPTGQQRRTGDQGRVRAAAERAEKAQAQARLKRQLTHALAALAETPEQKERRRAATSLKKILHHSPSTGDGERGEGPSLRARWQKSVFLGVAPLPRPASWSDAPQDTRQQYAMSDAIAHRLAGAYLRPQLREHGLNRVYRLDRDVLPFLVLNERVGLACDANELRRLSKRFKREFAAVCDQVNELAGFDVNPCSGEQVSDCLFQHFQIRPTRLTKGGKHYTTQDKYLKARRHEHDIIPKILEARELNKLIGTYADKLPTLLREGRYHPDWKYTRTATGRLAEEVILLIPKHTARGKMIRNAFHADDGHTLVSCDLSQIELRTMAHLSGDEHMLRAFVNGEDYHAQVAHELLGAPKRKQDQDESKHRLPAKTVNFGIINGMSEYGLVDQLHEAGQLHWTVETVRELLIGWFKIHSGVDHYWKGQIALARRQGYVTDLFGRRRYLSAVHSESEQVRREAERQCLCPIQATADGISKVWNKAVWDEVIQPRRQLWSKGEYCAPWVRIHDDTTLETDSRIAKPIGAAMLRLVPDLLCIPTTAEVKTGRTWGDLH